MTDDAPTPDLVRLASAYGIATEYWSFFGDRVQVPASTLRAVLAAMGIDASTDAAVSAALVAEEERVWRELLPASFVTRAGVGVLWLHVFDGHDVTVTASSLKATGDASIAAGNNITVQSAENSANFNSTTDGRYREFTNSTVAGSSISSGGNLTLADDRETGTVFRMELIWAAEAGAAGKRVEAVT